MFENLLKEFSRREEIYDANAGAIAREEARRQVELWNNFISSTLNAKNFQYSDNQNFRQDIGRIRSYNSVAGNRIFTVQQVTNGWLLQGKMPLLSDSFDAAYFIEKDVHALLVAICFEFSLAATKINDSNLSFEKLNVLTLQPYLALSMCYAAERAAHENADSDRKRISHFQSIIQKYEKTARELETHTHDMQNAYKQHANEAVDVLEDFRKQSNEAALQVARDADAKIEARLNAKEELEKIRAPVQLWSLFFCLNYSRYRPSS